MPFVSFLKEDGGMWDIHNHRPEKLNHFNHLIQEVMRGESAFTPQEREILAIYVSASNNCPFCFGTHSALAVEMGVDETLLEQMVEDLDNAPVDEKLKPVLRYVKKLTLTPYKMTQADADAVYAAGWDSDALSDAVFVCGVFNLANRIIEGHGVNGAIPKEVLRADASEWVKADKTYLPE